MKRNEYCAFWVGLLDGDGSIQVNHCRKKILQYRIVIKLKKTEGNEEMLKLLTKYVGGRVRTNKDEVLWVEDNKERILNLLEIFKEFPPLTKRLRCQIKFMEECYKDGNIEKYMQNRNLKYKTYNEDFDFSILPSYFPYWLSGFIEAEGSFSIRKSTQSSFSIGQKEELALIEAIKKYFGASNKILLKKNKFFLLEIYNKSILLKIIDHCSKFPLLGEKLFSFQIFKNFHHISN